MYISIDHSALSLFNDSTIARLNPDGDGDWNTWKDALTNGNSPGMDVNFDTFAAYGLTNIDGSGDLSLGTITMTGFSVDGAGAVDINGGAIDGTTIGATTPSTVDATTIVAGNDVTFNGDNFVSYSETSIHNNLIVLDNATGTTTQFSVDEATGNTSVAGTLDVTSDLTAGTVTMTGFSVDADGDVVSKSFNNTSGGITNAGAISGATTVTASGAVTGGSLTDGTATLTSGALSGATNVDGSGDLTMGTVTMTGFSVDADGDVVSKSLNNTSGGITNTGSIAGATTINASGAVTGGSLTDGTATLTGGVMSGITGITLSGANLDSDDLTLSTVGSDGDIVIDSDDEIHMTADFDFEVRADDDVLIYSDVDVSGDGGMYIYNYSSNDETEIWSQNTINVDADGGKLELDGSGGIDIGVESDVAVDMDASTLDIDASSTVDVNGTAVTIDGSGALTLGGSSVDVDADGGTLSLDGSTGLNIGTNADQPIDMDASTLDIDATTITVDATTTTFTGKVEGPNATADNQFTTYYQLDSLANRAPFNETLRRFRLGTSQSILAVAGATRVALSGSGIYTESSDPVENPVDPLNPPMSIQSTGGQHINLSDPGIYQVMLTMEVSNAFAPDALALVEIYNYDALQTVFPTLRVLASDTKEVYGTANAFSPVNSHLNLSMTFEADNSNEDIYIQITTYGQDISIEGYGFTVSRIGEQ